MADKPEHLKKLIASLDGETRFVSASASCAMNEARGDALDKAERVGIRLHISPIRVRVIDGSEQWAGTMTDLLCSRPELADATNELIMQEISAMLNLTSPLEGNRMSKKLSAKQCAVAQSKLTSAGYDGTGVKTGTDVKRAVKSGKAAGVGNAHMMCTDFEAAGIVIDGKHYGYRQRDRASTGSAWNDLSIRIAGVDVPLVAVLKLRGISVGAFIASDAAAIAAADAESLSKRDNLDREARPKPALANLTATLERLLSTPNEASAGLVVGRHARAKWSDRTQRECA